MGIKWLQAEDQIVIRRRANPHRQHPSEKIAWRESSTLPSSSPCSSRRYIRSAQRKSDRDRSKIPIVEKPSAVKLTLENVTILKRETAATNLQSTENPMVDVATDRCPTNKSSTDFEDLQKDIPMVNRNPNSTRDLVSSHLRPRVLFLARRLCSRRRKLQEVSRYFLYDYFLFIHRVGRLGFLLPRQASIYPPL